MQDGIHHSGIHIPITLMAGIIHIIGITGITTMAGQEATGQEAGPETIIQTTLQDILVQGKAVP
jgi:hypothetical protein